MGIEQIVIKSNYIMVLLVSFMKQKLRQLQITFYALRLDYLRWPNTLEALLAKTSQI